jgi:uncharacterized protein
MRVVTDVAPSALALLMLAALASGFVDAIAGGGGVITLPALLAAGLPPHLALGTNKGQAVFGSGAALWRFSRAGLVHGPRGRAAFPAGVLGSLLGAELVLLVPPSALRPVVLVLLLAVALFLTLRRTRPVSRIPRAPRHELWTAAAIALVIGAYDGFFGPGTGTFLIVAFVYFFDAELTRASADAKVVNFASNLAAMALFASRGTVLWSIALPMAAAQLAGAFVGSHVAVKGGDGVVRAVVLVVVLVLVCKLALDLR